MSRKYCDKEFILDTKHLLNMVNELNKSQSLKKESINLLAIDVEKLYPSIQPALAEEAWNDLFLNLN